MLNPTVVRLGVPILLFCICSVLLGLMGARREIYTLRQAGEAQQAEVLWLHEQLANANKLEAAEDKLRLCNARVKQLEQQQQQQQQLEQPPPPPPPSNSKHAMAVATPAPDSGDCLNKGIIGNLLLKLEVHDMLAVLRNVPAGICVDVGGHVGHTAAEMASHGHRVHVFEPFEGNLAQLRTAVAKYGERVTIYHGAVSDVSGMQAFGGATATNRDVTVVAGESSYIATAGTSAVGKLGRRQPGVAADCQPGSADCVQTFVLDDMFSSQRLLLVKIDVQGGEPHVRMMLIPQSMPAARSPFLSFMCG
jgi:FkbM family methyltransferase